MAILRVAAAVLIACCSSALGATGDCEDEGRTCVTARRIDNASAPLIDGDLTDAAWETAGLLEFPDAAAVFTIAAQRYATTDPSRYRLAFLHDDVNLYIGLKAFDRMVESATDAQYENSDGLAGMAFERKDPVPEPVALFRLTWHREMRPSCPTRIGPPLDRDRMAYDAEWRCRLHGTWNEGGAADDGGYECEIAIPLNDPKSGGVRGLGGWKPGDRLKANFVIADHDSAPGRPYDDPTANFAKLWWAGDVAETLVDPDRGARYIQLSDASVTPRDDLVAVAPKIHSSRAPRIDGIPNEAVWLTTRPLRFPSSVGRSFTLSKAGYNGDDPSTYEVLFLHDGRYLYVAAATTDDFKIESASGDDQASDGLISLVFKDRSRQRDHRYSAFWSALDQWERTELSVKDCGDVPRSIVDVHFQQGPPAHPYRTASTQWAPSINGTWNDARDVDRGYAFELRIALADLGGYQSGESIPANIVLVDHDGLPDGAYDSCDVNFKKFWWGFDGNEFFFSEGMARAIDPSEERFIRLDDNDAPPAPVSIDPKERVLESIIRQQVPYSGLIRSFPEESAAHTYDNAQSLIALTDGGKGTEAARLANALIRVAMSDADDTAYLYDAYSAIDSRVSQGTGSGTGPNAWAALALWHYGNAFDVRAARDTAMRIAKWIHARLYDPSDGGVFGGICHPFEERPEDSHRHDSRLPYKSTEQVLDTWQLFRALPTDNQERALAVDLETWLLTPGLGWIETDDPAASTCRADGRFSTGVNPQCVSDRRLFLDTQSWGSTFAIMAGEPEKAIGALRAAEAFLSVTTTVDGIFVAGFNDSCLTDRIIWYGGTAQMVVAYRFAGELGNARKYVSELLKGQNQDGSWNHSSAGDGSTRGGDEPCDSYESFHLARPSTGESSWVYFALRAALDGARLPFILGGNRRRSIGH